MKTKNDENIALRSKVKSIKGKLMTVLCLACVLLFTVTGIIVYYEVYTNSMRNQKSVLFETSQKISKEAELFFQKYITMAQQMALDKNIQNFLISIESRDEILTHENFEIVRNTLIDIQKEHEDVILSAYIGEAEPSYYVDDIDGISDIDFDLKTRLYYKTITDGVVYITEPYVDVSTGNLVITITAPVYVEGKIEGLTGIDIEIDSLSAVVGNSIIGENGYFSLLTGDNTIASHKNLDNVLKTIHSIELSQNLIDNAVNNSEDVIEYTYNDEKLIGNITPIGSTGWKIISSCR